MKLAQTLGAQAIYLDEFFIPQRDWPQNQHPRFPFFYFRYQEFVNGIKSLAAGRLFTYHAYDWQIDGPSATASTIKPEGIILIEGVSALNIELASLYAKKIWVDSDTSTEMIAIEAREKGANLDLWKKIYICPAQKYIACKSLGKEPILFMKAAVS